MNQTEFSWAALCREENLRQGIISIGQLVYFFTVDKYNIPPEEKEKAAVLAYCVYKEKMGFVNHEELETEMEKIGYGNPDMPNESLVKNIGEDFFYKTYYTKPTRYNHNILGSRLGIESSEVVQTKSILKIFGDTQYFKNKTVEDWMSRETRKNDFLDCSVNGLKIIENLFNYRNDFKKHLKDVVEIFYEANKYDMVGVFNVLNKQTQVYELVNKPKLDSKKKLDLAIRVNQYLNLKTLAELMVSNSSFAMQNLKNLESYENVFKKFAAINNDSAPLYKDVLKRLDNEFTDDNIFGVEEDNPYRKLEMVININVMLKTYDKKERDLVNLIDSYLSKLNQDNVLGTYRTFEMRHPSGKNIKSIVAFFHDEVLDDRASELENTIKKQLRMVANNEYINAPDGEEFKTLLDDAVMRKTAGDVNVSMKPRKF